MKPDFGFLSRKPRKLTNASKSGFLARFIRDERGSYIAFMALLLPALVTIAALGSEGGYYLYNHRVIQSAADNAAYSVATALAINSSSTSDDLLLQAKAMAATDYGLVAGTNGVAVTVNRPPTGQCYPTSQYIGLPGATEVAITQSVTRTFSKGWSSGGVSICGRAVAIVSGGGQCILALGTTGTVISTTKNNLNISVTGCGIFSNSADPQSILVQGNNDAITAESIGTVGGASVGGNAKTQVSVTTGNPPIEDPYATEAATWPTSQSPVPSCPGCIAGTATPASCTNGKNAVTTLTLSAGTWTSASLSSLNLNKCTTVTMNAGTYLFSQGLTVPSGVTLNIGAGSTIIVSAGGLSNSGIINFLGGNYSMAITGGWTNTTTSKLNMGGNYSVSVTGDFTIDGTASTVGAGIYYISGNLNIDGSGGQTVTASNVTLVLTGASSIINYPANNSTFILSAPSTGWNAGIAVWEPTSTGSNLLASGNSSIAEISGVFYAPKADVQFLGNTGTAPNCTQILAKSVEFGGNSINIQGNCSGVPGVKTFGQIIALVE
jgi:hypothetical protein